MSVLELNANVTPCYCSETTEDIARKQLIQYLVPMTRSIDARISTWAAQLQRTKRTIYQGGHVRSSTHFCSVLFVLLLPIYDDGKSIPHIDRNHFGRSSPKQARMEFYAVNVRCENRADEKCDIETLRYWI